MTEIDAVKDVKTLLTAKWLKANTDDATPIFIHSYDELDTNNATRVSAGSRDMIRVYENSDERRVSAGVGVRRMERHHFVTIDLFSGTSKIHALKSKQEIIRIIETNISAPSSSFQYIIPDYTVKNFSGVQYQRLWRWAFDIEMATYSVALGG